MLVLVEVPVDPVVVDPVAPVLESGSILDMLSSYKGEQRNPAVVDIPMLLVALLPVPVLLDEDPVPVLPEDDELVAVLLEVEPDPVLDAVEPDVILVEVLEDESVPILLVDPVPMLLVDPVPMLLLLVDSPYPMRTGFSPVPSAQMQGQSSGSK